MAGSRCLRILWLLSLGWACTSPKSGRLSSDAALDEETPADAAPAFDGKAAFDGPDQHPLADGSLLASDAPVTADVAATDAPASPADLAPPAPDLEIKAGMGKKCSSAADCDNLACVEGVCCDAACTGTCLSCLKANTGTNQVDGHCAPVKAGVAHGSDCTAADPTSCGDDGKCDGAGACRKFGSGTMCRAESCPQGSATHTPASLCDGKGTCKSASASSCDQYLCNSGTGKCRTSCSNSATDCGASAYCNGASCVAKKVLGQICGNANQCASGQCGGRCCNPGTACTCTQPSPTNLLANPGFDSSLTGWTVGAGSGTITRASGDYEGCPFSGVAHFTVDTTVSKSLEQCLVVSPSTSYNFSLKARSGGSGELVTCTVTLYNVSGCSGNSAVVAQIDWINVDWGPGGAPMSFQTGPGGGSAKVACSVDPQGGTGAADLDFIYLTPAPNNF
jgi:hypothetical protein